MKVYFEAVDPEDRKLRLYKLRKAIGRNVKASKMAQSAGNAKAGLDHVLRAAKARDILNSRTGMANGGKAASPAHARDYYKKHVRFKWDAQRRLRMKKRAQQEGLLSRGIASILGTIKKKRKKQSNA